jgi:type IV pilus assembly protein PilC
MAKFKCSVVDEYGKKQKISRNGESKEEIFEYLKQNKYTIIDIQKLQSSMEIGGLGIKKIKARDLSVFCKQLYAMLKAGVTIVNSLDILRQQTESKKLTKIISSMYEDLQKGNTFSEALAFHKNVFPPIFISMVEAGELSGNIDVIMDRLSVHFEKEYKIENKVKGAMTYPIILSVVCVSVVAFLLTNVMPTFVDMYTSSGVELPSLTQTLINFSEVLQKWWYLFILFAVAVGFLWSTLKKNKDVRYKLDYYKLKMPVLNSLVLKLATSRFARTLATLMGSGVPLLQALDTVSGVTGNSYIGQKIIDAKEEVRRGMSLSQPLKKQGVFPPMLHSMIKIGEDSGAIEEILDKTADFYDEEVDTAVSKFTAMLEPVMIVVMAVVIGFIVIAMVMPMFDMVSTV